MPKILASIACNLDNDILQAALPLFSEERVEAIEWSFDTLYNRANIPAWFVELLATFSAEKRLIGHGVFFSIFSGRWSAQQEDWLKHLAKVCRNFQFDHITEHFGFMTGADFHKGAPISVPFNARTLAIGRDRLQRIQEVCQSPVGLENLAFAYSLQEVEQHGQFLKKLIEPINGFIILDLHNLYCQLHNFEVDYEDLIHSYPLDCVREIHISGGTWAHSEAKPDKQIRRDTHDDAVPTAVFELLKMTIPLCPNLKFVVLEQLGIGLENEAKQAQFQKDFMEMSAIIKQFEYNPLNTFVNNHLQKNTTSPLIDENLYAQQMALSNVLENAQNLAAAQVQLAHSSLANSDWDIENWQPEMLETAIAIARKWKKGWD